MKRALAALAALALSASAIINCGGDQKNPEAPTTDMPPAEPPPSDNPDAGVTSETPQTRDNALAAAMPESKPEPKAEPLTDEQIARVAEGVNDAEIAQAKVAQTKSKDADVKKFAAMMIAHHGEAKQRQAKLKLKGEDSGLATTMHADAASTLDVLKTASPEDFDKDYAKAQIDGHQKVLDALNDRLIPSATRPDVKALLEQVKPVVEEHLVRAKNLRATLESKKPAAATSAK